MFIVTNVMFKVKGKVTSKFEISKVEGKLTFYYLLFIATGMNVRRLFTPLGDERV